MSESDLTYPGGKVRLYVEAALGEGVDFAPSESQVHYLLHVMRAKAGDAVRLFNGRDGEWLARIAKISKRTCTLTCRSRMTPQSDVPDLWLVFAPIKKTPADYVVQKATEIGVRRLVPVITRRTIVTRVNLDRMRANAIEAAEQSGRLSVPDVAATQNLLSLVTAWPADRRLVFCDEAGDAEPIASALARLPPGPAAVLTGPEGGFEAEERTAIRALAAAVPVSLGPRILRADTAALAALSAWQALRGDWA
jgi:16S rRNA (uracil1498-N3)-methyltransferase